MTQQAVAVEVTPEFRKVRRRAILSAWAGFLMDGYSIYITTTVLLPALTFFQGQHMSASNQSIFSGLTLASTLVGRPLGGMIFGHLADRISRRRIGTITILGFGTMSLLIACLPGAGLVGTGTAITLLLLLRFIEGIFLGGEYTAATPLAVEYAPASHRGYAASLIQCAAALGPTLVAALMTLVLLIAPESGPNSPYIMWGWRIPFLIGFVLSTLVAWFIRRKVDDSETWKADAPTRKKTRSPLLGLLKGKPRRAFIQAWVLMTGIFFISNVSGSVGPQFLLKNHGFTADALAHTSLIIGIPAAVAYVFSGWLSDIIGRKPAFYIAGITSLIVVPASMTTIGSGVVPYFWVLTLLVLANNICLGLLFGLLPSYVNERFSTAMRSSGWGVAYGTSVIVPAFFSYYMVWLGHVMPFLWTAGLLVIVGVVLVLAATASGPETRGIDLRTAASEEELDVVATGAIQP